MIRGLVNAALVTALPILAVDDAASGSRCLHVLPADASFEVLETQDACWWYTREQGSEIVDLSEGTLGLHIFPREASGRFVARLPNAELETTDARITVTVAKRGGTYVQVAEGRITLRHGPLAAELGAGASFSSFE